MIVGTTSLEIPARIAVAHARDGSVVDLEFDDGFSGSVDFRDSIRAGAVTAPLRDPVVSSALRIGPRGRSLEWPGDVDFCSDALGLRTRSA